MDLHDISNSKKYLLFKIRSVYSESNGVSTNASPVLIKCEILVIEMFEAEISPQNSRAYQCR